MMASNNLPDIIEAGWGGYTKGYDDGHIIALNDLMKEHAPNFTKFLADNPSIDNLVRREDGIYDSFPFIANDDALLVYYGPMLRGDWLEDLGLEVPETIDEWHNVLTRFKNEKNAEAPFSYQSSVMLKYGEFIGAYGITNDFFVEDGKIVYGPADPRYKDFLTEFAKWYDEGLIDNSITGVNDKTIDTSILSSKTGATCSWGNNPQTWRLAMEEKEPRFKMVPAPHVTAVKGTIPQFGQKQSRFSGGDCAGISRSCKYPELAARVLDFAYSEKGNALYNFGIEGESYNVVGGKPVFTDLILNNPNGLGAFQAMGLYMRGGGGGPYIRSREGNDQGYVLPEQQLALELWAKVDMDKHLLPRLTLTQEETDEFMFIWSNITTLADEMTLKFIMGVEPLSEFDSYISKLKQFEVDKAVAIYQTAYERAVSKK